MGIRGFPTPPSFLNLLVLHLRSRLDDLAFACRGDAGLLQLLRDRLMVWDPDLLPDLPELTIEVLIE